MTAPLSPTRLEMIRAAVALNPTCDGQDSPAYRDRAELLAEVDRLRALINTPHTHDFIEAVRLEMPHQRERWGAEHDAGKTALDWFWLIGYLAQKAAYSFLAGDIEKAKHHVITTAAALGNWFLAITGESKSMRPGIVPPPEGGA